ncbi:amidase family protein, partial [Roseateles sp.]|uniref:amidase family protein n=1 Tax=Roseateles sp. TaxID=1971397 RepID=UPI003262E8C7
MPIDLNLTALNEAYCRGALSPRVVIAEVVAKARALNPEFKLFIHVLSDDELSPYLAALEGRSPADLPLYGVPFAIKDNIDLAGTPTTAACPAFAYTPYRSAFVVQRLIAAGAIPIGKTNMDQFATGLTGTRTPHGTCASVVDPRYVAGGSSSGSAVAVADGTVAFALAT